MLLSGVRVFPEVSFQRPEFIFVEKFCGERTVSGVKSHFIRLESYGDIRPYGHEIMAEGYMAARLLECRFLPGCQFVQMVVYLFCRAVCPDEFPCPYFPHAFHSWNIVRCISADGQDFYHLFRRCYPVSAADLGRTEDFPLSAGFSRPVLEYPVRYKLSVVFVRSDHIYGETLSCGLSGYCAYHIIRFISHHHQHRDVHGPAQFRERFEGIDHKLWSRFPRTFVFRVHLVPECSSGGIERDCKVGGFLLVYEFEYVFGEPEQDGCVHAL